MASYIQPYHRHLFIYKKHSKLLIVNSKTLRRLNFEKPLVHAHTRTSIYNMLKKNEFTSSSHDMTYQDYYLYNSANLSLSLLNGYSNAASYSHCAPDLRPEYTIEYYRLTFPP